MLSPLQVSWGTSALECFPAHARPLQFLVGPSRYTARSADLRRQIRTADFLEPESARLAAKKQIAHAVITGLPASAAARNCKIGSFSCNCGRSLQNSGSRHRCSANYVHVRWNSEIFASEASSLVKRIKQCLAIFKLPVGTASGLQIQDNISLPADSHILFKYQAANVC